MSAVAVPPRRRWRDARGTGLLLLGWFVAVNAWGPFVLTSAANRPIAGPSTRMQLAEILLAVAGVLTVVVGADLARRRLWLLALLLALLAAACTLGWLLLSAVFFGNGLRSVIAVAVIAVPVVFLAFGLFVLGWPLGRLWRAVSGRGRRPRQPGPAGPAHRG